MFPQLRSSLCAVRSCVVEQIRCASGARAKGNRPCRQDGAQKGQEYGYKYRQGQFAKKGSMLVKQRIPRFFPGLNVQVKGDLMLPFPRLSLHAMVHGTVFVTREKVQLNPECKAAPFFDKRDMSAVYKKYYHIIPPQQHNEFELVAQI